MVPNFAFNTADAPAAEDLILPEGTYTMRVAESKPASQNPNSGKWSQNIILEVVEGPHAKRRVYHNVSIPTAEAYREEGEEKYKNAINFFLGTMMAFGIEGEFTWSDELLGGRTVKAVIKHETYQGETRPRVKRLIKHTVAATELLD